MSSRRKFRSVSVGLFFFQDIVFLATGIFMLVSVCFALSTRLNRLSIEAREETAEETRALIEQLARLNEEQKLETVLRRWHDAGIPPDEGTGSAVFSALETTSISIPGLFANEVFAAVTSPGDLTTANADLRARFHSAREQIAPPAIAMMSLEREYNSILAATLALEKNRNRILIHPEKTNFLHEPVFVLLGGHSLSIEWLDRPALTQKLSRPFTPERLAAAFAPFSPEQQLIVLMVRPSGATEFAGLRNWLIDQNFLIGYEPVPEDFELNFNPEERVIDIVW